MQRGGMLTTIFKRLANSGTAPEPAAFRKVKNPCQILKNNSARTDIGVPDFGIAHLSRRQTDIASGCTYLGVRICIPNRAEVFCVLRHDCISVGIRVAAKAVHNDECSEFFQSVPLARSRKHVHSGAGLKYCYSASCGVISLPFAMQPSAAFTVRFLLHCVLYQFKTTFAKSSATRLAPPIRPPSICGIALSPAAFFAFMLPPYKMRVCCANSSP